MVDAAVAEFGEIDILVNNAGIIRRSDAVDFSEADWDAVMNVNLKSAFFLTQAVGRRMVAARPRQDHQHRLDAVVPRRHPRGQLHREQERHRRPDPTAGERVGRQGHQRRTPSRPAISPPTTPRAASRRGPQPRNSRAHPGRPLGRSQRSSAGPPSSSRRPLRTTCTARSSRSTAAGWPDSRPSTVPRRQKPRLLPAANRIAALNSAEIAAGDFSQ